MPVAPMQAENPFMAEMRATAAHIATRGKVTNG
jgi:hypothetical protein